MTGLFCGIRGRRRLKHVRFMLEEKGYRKSRKKVKNKKRR